MKNVEISGGAPLGDERVQAVIAKNEARLGNRGRLLLRPSGTEPLIRVMAEGDDEALIESVVDDIVEAVKAASMTNA
jgi:phosphoglucosamine mutase